MPQPYANGQAPNAMGGLASGGYQAPPAQPIIPPYVNPCHPKFMSFSVDSIPDSLSLANQARVPVGLILRPLAALPEGEPEVPVLNFHPTSVVRCDHCRAYINPFVTFNDGGNHWTCSLCQKSNKVEQTYFRPLAANGLRDDIQDRPELMNCTYEIEAPKEYTVRMPMPPAYVFLIDVSAQAVRSGMVRVVADTILQSLDYLPGGGRTQVAFITFDSKIHFYALRPGSSTPIMHVVPDLDDLHLPRPRLKEPS
jgi:protein transport protein SEC24